MESFFRHLKDYVDYQLATDLDEVCAMVNAYIDYYNGKPRQWMTPVQYEGTEKPHIILNRGASSRRDRCSSVLIFRSTSLLLRGYCT